MIERNSDMALDEAIDELRSRLDRIASEWKVSHENDPDIWPLMLPWEEWFDHLIASLIQDKEAK